MKICWEDPNFVISGTLLGDLNTSYRHWKPCLRPKSYRAVSLPIRQPHVSARSTGRFCVKFVIGDFVEISRNLRFGYRWAKTAGRLRQELRAFHCCRWH